MKSFASLLAMMGMLSVSGAKDTRPEDQKSAATSRNTSYHPQSRSRFGTGLPYSRLPSHGPGRERPIRNPSIETATTTAMRLKLKRRVARERLRKAGVEMAKRRVAWCVLDRTRKSDPAGATVVFVTMSEARSASEQRNKAAGFDPIMGPFWAMSPRWMTRAERRAAGLSLLEARERAEAT